MAAEKPRVRVKAGATAFPAPPNAPARATMRHLRPDKSGLLNMRRAVTRDAKVDVIEIVCVPSPPSLHSHRPASLSCATDVGRCAHRHDQLAHLLTKVILTLKDAVTDRLTKLQRFAEMN